VHHWSCIAKRFKALREEWAKETTEERDQRMFCYDEKPEGIELPRTACGNVAEAFVPFCTIATHLGKNLGRINLPPGETRVLLMTCPKCKRLVFELDETYLCPWCVSLEEEL
jgi:hypothetical protein